MAKGKFSIPIKRNETMKMTAGKFDKPNKWQDPSNGMHLWPRSIESFSPIDKFSKKYIFDHYSPKKPIFNKQDKIITIGSCFAERLRRWLDAYQKNTEYIDVAEGLSNTHALRQYFEWVILKKINADSFNYEEDQLIENEREEVLKELKKTKGFVITLGLSEIWRNKKDKKVFWRGVPDNLFDPEIHESVVSSVEENTLNLQSMISTINKYLGKKHIIITLSPVPLNATFQSRPAIISDCVSKSILRVSIENIFKDNIYKNVYYWPSFEMVRWAGSHIPFATLYEDNTTRHVNNKIVSLIIDNFVKSFFHK